MPSWPPTRGRWPSSRSSFLSAPCAASRPAPSPTRKPCQTCRPANSRSPRWRSPGLHGTQKEVLDAAQKSVQQGTRVINQLLVLAALERKRRPGGDVPRTQVSVALVEAIDLLAPLAQQRQIDLGIGDLDETVMVSAPAYLLRELVSNLVDNAIQHTPLGSTVTVA